MILRLLLALSFAFALSAQPADLVTRIDFGPYDQDGVADVTVDVLTNAPLADPEITRLELGIFGGLTIVSWSADPGFDCTEIKYRLTCNMAPFAAGETARIKLRVFVENDTRHEAIHANLTWKERGHRAEVRTWQKDQYRYRTEYVVTNNDDDGPGSLRQAILDANAGCTHYYTPCLLRFDLARPATIRPLAPLPAIEADELFIEGGGVTLDGSLLDRPANGLTIAAAGQSTVRGLTVRGFPENGIEVNRAFARIDSSTISGNRSRGITVIRNSQVSVVDSVVSDNGRSGLFSDGYQLSINRSVIERNGASGVFYGPSTAGSIVDSIIADNAHFGVATVRDNRDVDVGRNRIFGNRISQIDVGLDGPSFFPFVRNQYAPPNGPTLTSATYDAATNTTTIRGRLEQVEISYFLRYEAQFFANDQFIGAIGLSEPDFTFTVKGDLRGQRITANSIRFLWVEYTERTTSELSAPIEVQ
jgi:Right handed beta helix region